MYTKALAISLVMFLFACDNNHQENRDWVKPESITISCDEYFNETTKLGVLTNNVWNKHAAEDDEWSQCLEKRIVNNDVQFGWSWSWPFGRKVIYSQPQIKMGASPWAPEPKFDAAFPLTISALKKLTISHSLDISTNGDHNTVTTMWLTTSSYKGSEPKPSIIAVEVMIWTYATEGHFNPAGNKRDEITIGNTTWEVWFKKDWDDKSGVNKNIWANLSFRNKNSSHQADIPALSLLNYAIKNNLIADNLYIADIELGNEVMSGSGMVWVNDFKVDYE